MLTEAYLGLGSNLGNRRNNITWAVDCIKDMSSSLTCSSLYESRPQGFDDQPWFMNAVCHLWTTMDPFSLLAALRAVQESVDGRRAFTNGPRVLDIDILLYGSSVIDTPVLAVPHPRMWERGFVLAPLAELSPHLRHQATDEPVLSLLNRLSPTLQAVKSGPPVTRPVPD